MKVSYRKTHPIAFFCALFIALVGCKQKPDTTIPNPREWVMERVRADVSRCMDEDPALCVDGDLDAILDKKLRKKPIPTSERKLKGIADSMAQSIRTQATTDPKLKAELLVKIDKRFRNPITLYDDKTRTVFADFSHLPAEFFEWRGRFKLRTLDRYVDSQIVTGLALAEALDIARKVDPNWRTLAIKFKTDALSPYSWTFVYGKDGSITFKRGVDVWVTGKFSIDELRTSQTWWKTKESCHIEQPPSGCERLSKARFGFQKLKKQ